MKTIGRSKPPTYKGLLIGGGYIVQDCEVVGSNVYIRKCKYCGQQHLHGAGGVDWAEQVQSIDGFRTLGHRVAHCVSHKIKYALLDGTYICNSEHGYYLGIGDQLPDVSNS